MTDTVEPPEPECESCNDRGFKWVYSEGADVPIYCGCDAGYRLMTDPTIPMERQP